MRPTNDYLSVTGVVSAVTIDKHWLHNNMAVIVTDNLLFASFCHFGFKGLCAMRCNKLKGDKINFLFSLGYIRSVLTVVDIFYHTNVC